MGSHGKVPPLPGLRLLLHTHQWLAGLLISSELAPHLVLR